VEQAQLDLPDQEVNVALLEKVVCQDHPERVEPEVPVDLRADRESVVRLDNLVNKELVENKDNRAQVAKEANLDLLVCI
jgi:hypothetical protein